MSQGTRTLALKASQGCCVYRQSQLDERSLSSSLRREKGRRAETEINKERRERGESAAVCQRRSRVDFQNAPVCALKTPVSLQTRSFWLTRERFESTHGSVFTVHTGAGLLCKKERNAHTHSTPRHNHNNTHSPTKTHHTTTEHQQHTTHKNQEHVTHCHCH